jgi:DNA-binding PadR family transcriptional regulator
LQFSKDHKSSELRKSQGMFSRSLQVRSAVPRGLWQFYILHLIAEVPSGEYEILESLEKVVKSSRPSLRSIKVTLRKFAKERLIRESSKNRAGGSRSIYEITPKGMDFLRIGKEVLANSDRNWFAMRRIFIELMEANQLPMLLREGSRENFQLSREIIEDKLPKLSKKEGVSALKNYALNLGQQLEWTKKKLHDLKEGRQSRQQQWSTLIAQVLREL